MKNIMPRQQMVKGENMLRRRSERLRLLRLKKGEKIDVNYADFIDDDRFDDLVDVIEDEKDSDYDFKTESKKKHTSGKRAGKKRSFLNAEINHSTIHQENQGRLESPGRREDSASEMFPSKPSPFVLVTNEFSYKESLMDFAKAGGHLAERIAQKYYDHNQAMVFLRRKQQENIMKSFHQRSQEQCIPPLFLFQQQQQQQPHQMNYRRILPMHQKWNPNLDNLNPPHSLFSTNGGMFGGVPPSGYGNLSAQNMGFLSQLGVTTTSVDTQRLASFIRAPSINEGMLGCSSSEFGSYTMGQDMVLLPSFGVSTSTDGSLSVPRFMETPAVTSKFQFL